MRKQQKDRGARSEQIPISPGEKTITTKKISISSGCLFFFFSAFSHFFGRGRGGRGEINSPAAYFLAVKRGVRSGRVRIQAGGTISNNLNNIPRLSRPFQTKISPGSNLGYSSPRDSCGINGWVWWGGRRGGGEELVAIPRMVEFSLIELFLVSHSSGGKSKIGVSLGNVCQIIWGEGLAKV